MQSFEALLYKSWCQTLNIYPHLCKTVGWKFTEILSFYEDICPVGMQKFDYSHVADMLSYAAKDYMVNCQKTPPNIAICYEQNLLLTCIGLQYVFLQYALIIQTNI